MDNPFFDANDQSGLQMGRNLPHWHQSGKMVFVTFRLNDSLPQAVLETYALEKEEWMQKHPKPWDDSAKKDYYERFSNKLDKWLDAGIGSCMLSDDQNRVVVEEALKYYDGLRYDLKAYVVMPNHVHVLFQLKESFLLSDIVRKWKSYTAKLINKNEKREGRVWQSESFDHILRNEMQFYHIVKYIYDNNHSLAFVKNAEWLAMQLAASRSEQEYTRSLRDAANYIAALGEKFYYNFAQKAPKVSKITHFCNRFFKNVLSLKKNV